MTMMNAQELTAHFKKLRDAIKEAAEIEIESFELATGLAIKSINVQVGYSAIRIGMLDDPHEMSERLGRPIEVEVVAERNY
jgi:hypothetical protein